MDTQTIEEVWNSEKLNNIRSLHNEGKRNTMPICKHCVASIKAGNTKTIIDQAKCHIADYQT